MRVHVCACVRLCVRVLVNKDVCVRVRCGTPPRHTVSRRLARGGNLARSPRAKKESAPSEHRPCNCRSQGRPAQARKHDVRKTGRQPPPVPLGQRIVANVASLGTTARARDVVAHPKQQPRQTRPPTSGGQWHGVGPCQCRPPRRARADTSPHTTTRPHVRRP